MNPFGYTKLLFIEYEAAPRIDLIGQAPWKASFHGAYPIKSARTESQSTL